MQRAGPRARCPPPALGSEGAAAFQRGGRRGAAQHLWGIPWGSLTQWVQAGSVGVGGREGVLPPSPHAPPTAGNRTRESWLPGTLLALTSRSHSPPRAMIHPREPGSQPLLPSQSGRRTQESGPTELWAVARRRSPPGVCAGPVQPAGWQGRDSCPSSPPFPRAPFIGWGVTKGGGTWGAGTGGSGPVSSSEAAIGPTPPPNITPCCGSQGVEKFGWGRGGRR